MHTNSISDIQSVAQSYFRGIFEGDLQLLQQAFHPNCLLYGDLKGTPYEKDLQAYLAGVQGRKSPKERGEDFQMKVTSIEAIGDNAIVKAHLHMLGHEYHDFLSFSKSEGKWQIVNKLFTEL
ncbi:MAG: nuclear transport factor 2 family protein [Saprospiraceae bacterium]|nr:nuclear transport factor 2 family protein [Saprospiraceae bacterium]